ADLTARWLSCNVPGYTRPMAASSIASDADSPSNVTPPRPMPSHAAACAHQGPCKGSASIDIATTGMTGATSACWGPALVAVPVCAAPVIARFGLTPETAAGLVPALAPFA